MIVLCFFFFFKQKTAYEMRISDWSSDVCSSDLVAFCRMLGMKYPGVLSGPAPEFRRSVRLLLMRSESASDQDALISAPISPIPEIGRASCRERVCQYV